MVRRNGFTLIELPVDKLRVASKHEARGFTLIELLVVVAIISLLISILLPSLKNAREQAKFIVCQANVQQISTALHTYAAEYSGWYPVVIGDGGGRQSWPGALARAKIIPEGKDEDIRYPSGATGRAVPDKNLGVYQCPLELAAPSSYMPETYGNIKRKLSYCANFLFLGLASSGSGPIARGVKISSVDRPAERMLFIEHNSGLASLPTWYDPWWDHQAATTHYFWWRLSDHSRPGFAHLASKPQHVAIHGDGHVEPHPPEVTFSDLNTRWDEFWATGNSRIFKWSLIGGKWVPDN